jgi:hypothetical protein
MVRSTYREQAKSRDECLQKSNEPGGSRDGCEKALTPIVIFNEYLQLAPAQDGVSEVSGFYLLARRMAKNMKDGKNFENSAGLPLLWSVMHVVSPSTASNI